MSSVKLFILVSICACVSVVFCDDDNDDYGFDKGKVFDKKSYGDEKYGGDDYYGGKKFKYVPKFECRSDKDCGPKEVCSDGYCNPGCPPCHEWDFTIWKCRNLCTRKATCDYKRNKCFCKSCLPMSGYDSFWNCTPPKFLRGICHDRGYGGKHFGYKDGKKHFGKDCQGYDCPKYL